MESMPHSAVIMLLALPVLGLGILSIVLFALGANREKWIVPGVAVMIMTVAGFSAAMEYGGKVADFLENSISQSDESATDEGLEDPDSGTEPTEWPGDTYESVASSERPPDKSWSDYKDDSPRWIKADGKPDAREPRRTRPSGRRTMVVNPTRELPRTEPIQPMRRTVERTVIPTPPTPIPTPPVETTPIYTPTPATPAYTPPTPTPPPYTPPTPTPRPTPPARSSGGGTLVIKIKGPLLETSPVAVRSPHLLIILDGRLVEIMSPTETTKQHKDDNPSRALLAVTYWWKDLYITFTNLEAGHHMVMIDSSLENPSAHQAAMTNPGTQGQNDWNGSVEIKSGKTTTIEFGAKNWHNGLLSKIR